MGKASDYNDVPANVLNPDPPVWPVCDTCGTAYVLRRCISLTAGWFWGWMKDCDKPKSTCKNAGAEMHDKDGKVADG